jgi:ATP-dependent Clp protease protease subunit
MEAADAAQPEPEELDDEDEGYDLVYVLFSAGIDPKSAEALLLTLDQCVREDVKEVRLVLSTTGGNVSTGIGLYNLLRGMPFRLVTHNAGDVASIGVAVYLAGVERLVCPKAKFLTHGVTQTPPPGQPLGAKWLRETLAGVLGDEDRLNAILAERTSLTTDQLAESIEAEQTTNAETAVTQGIAHRVEDIDIPEDVPVLTVPTG